MDEDKEYFDNIKDKKTGNQYYVKDTEARDKIAELITQIVSGTVTTGLATEDGALLTTEDGRVLLAERKIF